TGVLNGPITWTDNVSVATSATFDFTGNTGVNWNSGSLFGGGTLTNASIINLTTTGSRHISGIVTTLTNTGTITFPAGGYLYLYDNTTLNNQASGIIDFQSDCTVNYSGTGSFNIANEGLIKKTAGTGVTYIYPPVTNSGVIDVLSGELEFVDAFGLNNTIDGVIKGIATIDLPAAANFTNDGTFAPGGSPGILTVLGTYKSSSTSMLDVELNGLTQGTEYDLLAITGTNAIFEGTVDVSLGFDANIGDSFTIATVSGVITTKNLVSPTYADYGCMHYTFDITYPNDKEVLLTISEKKDILPPEVVTQDITVQVDASGNVSITPSQIDNGSTDNCTLPENLIFELDRTDFTCADLGDNTVTLTVTDEAGNSASKTAVVTVEDDLPPVLVVQDITVQLDANGSATISAKDIDNGSTDNCTLPENLIFELDKTDFTCADLGDNTVTLTVTDESGNSDSATAIVTVEDDLPPVLIVQDITVQLDANGSISISPNDIDNGSTDNCTLPENLVFDLDITDFTCADLGENTVTLTVTDEAGNSASETAVVTVEDDLPPVLVVQNMTVQLDANGSATISAEDIDNGTTDNCTVSSLRIDIDTFGCSNVGANTVNFTAEDQSGNTSTVAVTVTVTDPLGSCNQSPVAVCQPVTVNADTNCQGNATAQDFDGGSTDPQGLPLTFTVDP
ncbi:MAG: hypothetical protein WBA61_05665, partial [Aequorivita sp.]